MKAWYLIYTHPRKEQFVSQQLEDRGLETYFPALHIDRGYNRGVRVEPFLPHYLFVKIDMIREWSTDLRWLMGIRTVVQFEGYAAVVPDIVIATLRGRLEPYANKVLERGEWCFQPGQRVRVTSGPFSGLEAIFQKGLKGSDRVQILLQILGSEIRTELSGYAIEAA